MVESLTAIANRHCTAKRTAGPKPAGRCHDYASVYDTCRWPLRYQAVTQGARRYLLVVGAARSVVNYDVRLPYCLRKPARRRKVTVIRKKAAI